jgi:hypothetical protein
MCGKTPRPYALLVLNSNSAQDLYAHSVLTVLSSSWLVSPCDVLNITIYCTSTTRDLNGSPLSHPSFFQSSRHGLSPFHFTGLRLGSYSESYCVHCSWYRQSIPALTASEAARAALLGCLLAKVGQCTFGTGFAKLHHKLYR